MTSSDCPFCGIAEGRIPAAMVAQDDDRLVAFRDIRPQAPIHILVIPRRHVPSLGAASPEDTELLGALLGAARDIAHREGVAEDGYRVVINVGADGGQTVDHLHLHLLAGSALGWPPG